MTDEWDATNPHHKNIAHGIEVGDGIPEMRSIAACRTALQNVGLEIVHEEDLADRPECVLAFGGGEVHEADERSAQRYQVVLPPRG